LKQIKIKNEKVLFSSPPPPLSSVIDFDLIASQASAPGKLEFHDMKVAQILISSEVSFLEFSPFP
jgi:hypothetical protein